ncbi:MAG TPA: PDR/VanB family oxidoreductase, partial [Nocardioides sp.]
ARRGVAGVSGTPATRVPPSEQPGPTMRVLDGLVRRVALPLALHTGGSRPAPPVVDRDLACVVQEVRRVATDVVTVRFARADGTALPPWFPGAHVDVLLPERLGGGMRQYSLLGDPEDGPGSGPGSGPGRAGPASYRVGVRRIDPTDGGGGGSLAMHALRVGDTVTLRGPRHAFPLIDAPAYLFVAGGIGITPILPMLRRVVAAGDRPWRIVQTGRTRATMPFLDEVADIARAAGARHDQVRVWPDDTHGVPDGEQVLAQAPPGAALYVCGPVPMIDEVRRAVPDERVASFHHERFSPPPVRGGASFTLRLARSGASVEVGPEESALAAVQRLRPAQAYSCRQGFCGTCRVGVLAGTVDHRDGSLAPAERAGAMMLCVSRGVGEVVIDA